MDKPNQIWILDKGQNRKGRHSLNQELLLDGDGMNLLKSLPFKTVKQALNDTINDSGTNNLTNDKLTTRELGLKKNFLDVTKLIRSIQRAEGNPDCFRRAQSHCDQLGCSWRLYCLEKPQCLPY